MKVIKNKNSEILSQDRQSCRSFPQFVEKRNDLLRKQYSQLIDIYQHFNVSTIGTAFAICRA